MLACLGDLIDDVVVRIEGDIQHASDTAATITRRQGGSAANVAVAAALTGAPVRFLGQVGADPIGRALANELAQTGVDVSLVATGGATGTIVVLVDAAGERTMLTDRKACVSLTDPQPGWLDGVTVLHIPLYSLIEGDLAVTSRTLAGWAIERGIAISIDAASSSVITSMGRSRALGLIASVDPAVLFANEDEAFALGLDDTAAGTAITIVKRGSGPSTVLRVGEAPTLVPANQIGRVSDTTGAGDAFAAGVLTYGVADPVGRTRPGWQTHPEVAVTQGHDVAAKHLLSR